jgi:hypothetical protein
MNNVLARLEQLEKENKLLKQWAARLKERLDKPPEPKPAGMSRGQRALNWGMVVGLVFLGMNVVTLYSNFNGMKTYVSTKELHIVNEDGNIGITLHNSKEHGPRLSMSDTIKINDAELPGANRIIMAVTKDGRPSLSLYRTADKPKMLEAGPLGILISIPKEQQPGVFLQGPDGKGGIYLGTKPKPTLEISGEDGGDSIRLP